MPSHTTDTVAFMAMDSQPMVPTVDTAMDSMARGLLMLSQRLMPSHGTDMVASMAMDSLPADTAMDSTERGLLTPSLRLKPSHGTDMVASTATVLAMAMVATPMASKQPTTF